jgi:Ulp1 family protease
LGRNGHKYVKAVKKYLEFEHRAKYGKDLPSDWETIGATPEGYPRQQNGKDCGVFVCMAIYCIIRGLPFNFTGHEEHMRTYRLRVVNSILQGQIVY